MMYPIDLWSRVVALFCGSKQYNGQPIRPFLYWSIGFKVFDDG
jgi:hypothetical protein